MRNAIKNGEIIKECDAMVPITSRAVQYSFSVYEALRITNSHIVHLDEHLSRLRSSAKAINLTLSFSDSEIESWLFKLIENDKIKDATARILVIGGDYPALFITYQDLLSYPENYYEDGVKCDFYFGERFLPYAKTSNLLMSYVALEEAKAKGCFEALFVNRNGIITEGTRSNFYAISGNRMYTADDSLVLSGVTRIAVLKAAKELGLEVVFEPPRYDDIFYFDSVFISSTSMAALPVSEIAGNKTGMKANSLVLSIRDLVRKWE